MSVRVIEGETECKEVSFEEIKAENFFNHVEPQIQ